MLIYDKDDFATVDVHAFFARTTAKQFYECLCAYWQHHVPLHPLYEDTFPIDGGYTDAHIAILHHFLNAKTFKKSANCILYMRRLLMYLEIDPPAELIDQEGLILNHLSSEEKDELDNGIFLGRQLFLTLTQMMASLNKVNQARADRFFSLPLNQQASRKEQYERLVVVRCRKPKVEVMRIKQQWLTQFSNPEQNGLRDFFLGLATRYLYPPHPEDLKSKCLTSLEWRWIDQLVKNKKVDSNHPLLKQTPLCFAVECEVEEGVKALIKRANINGRDETGRYPIQYAVKTGNIAIFDLLLKAEAKVNVQDKDGWSPLHYAVRYLYEPTWDASDGKTRAERLTILKRLLANNDDLALLLQKDRKGRTALFLQKDRKGRTALHYSMALGLTEVTDLIREALRKHVPDEDNLVGLENRLLDQYKNSPQDLNVLLYAYDKPVCLPQQTSSHAVLTVLQPHEDTSSYTEREEEIQVKKQIVPSMVLPNRPNNLPPFAERNQPGLRQFLQQPHAGMSLFLSPIFKSWLTQPGKEVTLFPSTPVVAQGYLTAAQDNSSNAQPPLKQEEDLITQAEIQSEFKPLVIPPPSNKRPFPWKKAAVLGGLLLLLGMGILLSLNGIGALLGLPLAVKAVTLLATLLGLGINATILITSLTGLVASLLGVAGMLRGDLKGPYNQGKERKMPVDSKNQPILFPRESSNSRPNQKQENNRLEEDLTQPIFSDFTAPNTFGGPGLFSSSGSNPANSQQSNPDNLARASI